MRTTGRRRATGSSVDLASRVRRACGTPSARVCNTCRASDVPIYSSTSTARNSRSLSGTAAPVRSFQQLLDALPCFQWQFAFQRLAQSRLGLLAQPASPPCLPPRLELVAVEFGDPPGDLLLVDGGRQFQLRFEHRHGLLGRRGQQPDGLERLAGVVAG